MLALDSRTGEQKWKFPMTDVTDSGIDSRTSGLLWKINLGAAINSGPMSYRIGNRQHVSVVSGLSLSVFALDE